MSRVSFVFLRVLKKSVSVNASNFKISPRYAHVFVLILFVRKYSSKVKRIVGWILFFCQSNIDMWEFVQREPPPLLVNSLPSLIAPKFYFIFLWIFNFEFDPFWLNTGFIGKKFFFIFKFWIYIFFFSTNCSHKNWWLAFEFFQRIYDDVTDRLRV